VKSVVKKGFVYLVGAGPGRADLITVRGAEVLRIADCVICDKLANPALLNLAPKNAEIISVPKRVGDNSFTQQEINRLLVEKASGGKTVVRLKGGDPCIFGRCAEEAAALADAGIDFEIVPGVTAGIAAADYTGIILTDRQYSSQVVFVTGQEAEGKQQSNIDWKWLAKFQGTIVFYMGMGNLNSITDKLVENGMSQNTPAAVIADATLPTQRVVKSSLGRISEKCKEEKIEPPAVVIIGTAANSDARLDWFTKKPLFGKNIVVTRDACGNTAFAVKIICRGGNPIEFHTIRTKSLTESNEFLRVVARLGRAEFDWVIFTSSNGVSIFFEALQGLGKDARIFGSAKIAVIGSETATTLSKFGIKADFMPSIFTGEQLGKQLMCFTNLQGKKILLLRSQLARQTYGGRASMGLVELLEQAGADVLNVAIYTAVEQKSESGWLIERIGKGEIDWLTFASPSSVKMFFEQVPTQVVNSANAKVASIGPTTSEQLKNLGIRVDVTAIEHTIDGLLDAIEKTYL
jgi:uroporphyrinogen III methyltransferase/synthase